MSSDFYINFIRPHAGIIIKICRAYSDSQEDFEDLYQEVCLQIWRTRDNFLKNSEWSTWVYRISLNVCMTIKKKEAKRATQSTSLDSVPEVLSNDSSAFQEESLTLLYNAIKQLSDVDRAIILLYLEEKTYKEIAELIGTNYNNIGVRIQRIKHKLKKLIVKHHE